MKELVGRRVVINYNYSKGKGSIVSGTLTNLPLTVVDESGSPVTHLTQAEIKDLKSGKLSHLQLV